MSYPHCYQGQSFSLSPFFDELIMKTLEKNRHWYVQLMLLEQMLVQWQHPVASSEALILLHWEKHMLLYWHIAMAIKMASKACEFFSVIILHENLAAAGAILSK
jgi:hypothetical protein